MDKFRLAELLHSELQTMRPYQQKQFGEELKKTLPSAIKQAAAAARVDGPNVNVKNVKKEEM